MKFSTLPEFCCRTTLWNLNVQLCTVRLHWVMLEGPGTRKRSFLRVSNWFPSPPLKFPWITFPQKYRLGAQPTGANAHGTRAPAEITLNFKIVAQSYSYTQRMYAINVCVYGTFFEHLCTWNWLKQTVWRCNVASLWTKNYSIQESWAIAKTTARCAQYMGALKNFESPDCSPRLLFPKFVTGFCSDRY